MKLNKAPSFHPKLAAGLDFIFSVIMLWWFVNLTNFWWVGIWFLFRIALWAGLLWLVYYSPGASRVRHLLTLIVFNIGGSVFLLITDWRPARYLMEVIYVVGPAVSFWLLPSSAQILSFATKPERRWRLALTTVGVAGIFSAWFAVYIFQLLALEWWWLAWLITALLATFISGWWWREYGIVYNKKFFIWLAGLGLILSEILAVVWWWPIGYLVGGCLMAWLWYLLWLVLRFNLTAEGINWRRQKWFILINLFLIVLYLLILARWR